MIRLYVFPRAAHGYIAKKNRRLIFCTYFYTRSSHIATKSTSTSVYREERFSLAVPRLGVPCANDINNKILERIYSVLIESLATPQGSSISVLWNASPCLRTVIRYLFVFPGRDGAIARLNRRQNRGYRDAGSGYRPHFQDHCSIFTSTRPFARRLLPSFLSFFHFSFLPSYHPLSSVCLSLVLSQVENGSRSCRCSKRRRREKERRERESAAREHVGRCQSGLQRDA